MQSRQWISAMLAGALLAAIGSAPAAAAAPVPDAMTPLPVAAAPAAPAVVPDPAAWQTVIDGQIDAFQKADAARALSYAGAAFKKNFTDPAMFMTSIAASGYTPIFTSVSHSFGKFNQPSTEMVVQEVKFVGAKQELYEAVYVLGLEEGSWRVLGVQLMKTEGMGI